MKQIVSVPKSDFAYRKFLEYLKEEQPITLLADENKFLKYKPFLEELSLSNNSLFIIIDSSRCKILYTGQNMESIFGYNQSELKKRNIQLFFRALVPNQLSLPINLAKWQHKIHASNSEIIKKTQMNFALCGVRVQHKEGRVLSLLIKYFTIAKNENGRSMAGIATIDDVSHLLKGDFCWARTSYGKTNKCIGYFHSIKNTDQAHDIITQREKEILQLIAYNHSSKKIADVLFIAQNTVEKHRKNMLARTGAKDTTALVHICRSIGII